MNELDFRNLNFSLLGSGSQFNGEVKVSGDCIINSEFTGDIIIKDDGKLTVERNAIIEGNIYAKSIEVFGVVRGSINSSGLLTVRSGAEVSGKVKVKDLSIFPGAIMNIEAHTELS